MATIKKIKLDEDEKQLVKCIRDDGQIVWKDFYQFGLFSTEERRSTFFFKVANDLNEIAGYDKWTGK